MTLFFYPSAVTLWPKKKEKTPSADDSVRFFKTVEFKVSKKMICE